MRVTDEAEPMPHSALDEALEDAIYGFDAARLRSLIEQHSVDPNRRVGALDGGMPLLRIALDAEWERGVNDESYLPNGDCVVALVELGADLDAIYLGTTTSHEIATTPAYALLRHRVEDALRARSGSA